MTRIQRIVLRQQINVASRARLVGIGTHRHDGQPSDAEASAVHWPPIMTLNRNGEVPAYAALDERERR